MGAWGNQPFANDSALGWSSTIEVFAAQQIKDALKKFLSYSKGKRRQYVCGRFAHVPNKPVRSGRFRGVRYKGQLRYGPHDKKCPTGFGRIRGHEEAIAAAALLDELTPYSQLRYFVWEKKHKHKRIRSGWFSGLRWGDPGVHLHLNHHAEEGRLYRLAIQALSEALTDEPWIMSWNCPGFEKRALKALLKNLQAKLPNEITDEQMAKRRKWRRELKRTRAGRRMIWRRSKRSQAGKLRMSGRRR